MASTLHFQESLAETSLAEMLFTIHRHRVPGKLEVSREEVVKRLYISDGAIVYAGSSDRADSLGAYLYRIGKLNRKDLVETMRRREQAGMRHGQLLLEEGFFSPSELYEAIRGQMESIVWSIFAWAEGEVRFAIGEALEPSQVRIHLPIRQVIIRGIKSVPDPRGLVARLGKRTTVLRACYNPEELIEAALDADEFRLLRLVDGRKSLFDVCNAGPFSVSENARLLYAFHVLRLLERVEGDAAGAVRIRLSTEQPSL